ncbi:hypothetical protein AQJ64_00865 [Streptomyces griseoruber]|uniref:Uncharacterized protein n=1 Tax=Streptomyces griseoruber TaxID=1943 RepID=A0A117RGC5_9ACTN|nr:hypothetical protein AQJ64_00865 [Streptomyces griseoruber]
MWFSAVLGFGAVGEHAPRQGARQNGADDELTDQSRVHVRADLATTLGRGGILEQFLREPVRR